MERAHNRRASAVTGLSVWQRGAHPSQLHLPWAHMLPTMLWICVVQGPAAGWVAASGRDAHACAGAAVAVAGTVGAVGGHAGYGGADPHVHTRVCARGGGACGWDAGDGGADPQLSP
eukprot:353880-Chlamydomonas_euryale.AAC.1